jgi:uncharacterized membrane protein YjfL (UPF0719 family)
MNKQIALLGIIELLSALSIGVVIMLLTYRLIKYYGIKRLHIEHSNVAYNVLVVSVLFSVGYVVSGAIEPLLDSFRLLSAKGISTTELISKFILQGFMYVSIAYISIMLICVLGVSIYTHMTPLDELEEIRNNNVSVALIVGAIIIVMAMMTKGGIMVVLESLVPYPNLPPR